MILLADEDIIKDNAANAVEEKGNIYKCKIFH